MQFPDHRIFFNLFAIPTPLWSILSIKYFRLKILTMGFCFPSLRHFTSICQKAFTPQILWEWDTSDCICLKCAQITKTKLRCILYEGWPLDVISLFRAHPALLYNTALISPLRPVLSNAVAISYVGPLSTETWLVQVEICCQCKNSHWHEQTKNKQTRKK